jgi:hypothetical protein
MNAMYTAGIIGFILKNSRQFFSTFHEAIGKKDISSSFQSITLFFKAPLSTGSKDSLQIKVNKIALGFRMDLSGSIEQNRRHRRSMSRIFRIRIVQR